MACIQDDGQTGSRETLMTIRRMKTYTGGQGYVYQYYFVGKRPAQNADKPSTEYVFDVTSDRKTTFSVSIFVEQGALRTWAQSHGRSPSEAEEYAAAKMRLFQAFDEIEDMKASGRALIVDQESLAAAFSTLGVD